ncbi:E3 ubiquitin-protein ligase ZSWIM2-like [Haliotis rufescens]|uniref:E3 ubiquitin-protein ligase ZSWIM2-like n=1 Tax=Haliotis rufescens TaxID=6454 RepID=UPI00201F543E|nr:E3 ubiquitin-protein ligase ZSWIM2-like [Haliotis rufescens]
MSRSVPWRRTVTDACCWHQAEAQNATIYILRETGPTGFLLKEEGESKNFKVFLGDPHSCTCPVFRKEKDLCKHISWLLLKKFRVPKENPVTWQLGLVEREINEILRGQMSPRRNQAKKPMSRNATADADGRTAVQQRDIDKEDVCPICQEELLDKRLPVTYCKFGCGNSVHIKCMKIWAEHQQGVGDKNIKCPMCREDFGPFNLLKLEMRNASDKQAAAGRMDRHIGTCCRSCHIAPIEGKCYRCTHCTEYYLCQSCFNTPTHTQHSFEYRHKRNQRWRPAERMFGASVPRAVATDMMNRELSASDYDLLLQLDSTQHTSMTSDIPEEVVNMLPLERVRERSQLLAPGSQCRMCLRSFVVGQHVRKLPCKHKFHKDCIDNWLLHSRPTCPADGLQVWSPVTGFAEQIGAPRTLQARRQSDASLPSESTSSRGITLEVPGVGIASLSQGSAGRQDPGGMVRRPVRNMSMPHRPPSSMELAGVALGAEGERLASHHLDMENMLPGSRLLQRAMQHRNELAHQLAYMQAGEAGTPPLPAAQIDLGDVLRAAGSNSAPPVVERKPPTGSQTHARGAGVDSAERRGRGRHRTMNQTDGATIRHRSSSRERSNSQERQNLLRSIQAFQGLYLGNNPRINPPQGETTGNSQRQPANPYRRNTSLSTRSKRTPQLSEQAQRTVDIVMEGSHIDSLTLRDILR